MAFDDLWGGSERRKHIRSPMKANIRVFHDSFGQRDYQSVDISTGGVFLDYNEGDDVPDIGTLVKIQVQDSAVEAPIVEMRIVRKTGRGFGLEFL